MTYIPQNFVKDEFSSIMTKLSHLSLMEDNQTLPEIDESIFETECNNYFRCPFFDFCFPDFVEPDIEDDNSGD